MYGKEMYEKGMLIKTTPKMFDNCYSIGRCRCGKYHGTDSRDDTDQVMLPHQCDEWVIGGPEQIGALIADLQEALRSWKFQ